MHATMVVCRGGYSMAAAVVKGHRRKAVEEVAKRVMGKRKEVNTAAASPENIPWVPDPITGYYHPAAGGASKEVDAAELRAILLPQRVVMHRYAN
jgi:hypothetical protein